MAASEEACPICGGDFSYARCTGHQSKPFIDGRKYEALCMVCFSVPKTCWFDTDKNKWMSLNGLDYRYLYTIPEMVGDGFTKEEATISTKAVRSAIAKAKAKGINPPTAVLEEHAPESPKKLEPVPPPVLVEPVAKQPKAKKQGAKKGARRPRNDDDLVPKYAGVPRP